MFQKISKCLTKYDTKFQTFLTEYAISSVCSDNQESSFPKTHSQIASWIMIKAAVRSQMYAHKHMPLKQVQDRKFFLAKMKNKAEC